MSCLFNSYDPYFKQPFGAVRAGQTVHLSLCIPEELGYVDPHLVLQKEGKYDVPVHYRMKFDGQTPHQNHFSVNVVLGDPGLYFYYFDLYTDFRRIVRGADNCGVVSWQEGESWQITVYEPDFQTPECIKGKVFYQIFPDRFCEGIENKPMPFPDRLYQADKHAEPFWQPNETGGHLNEDYFGGDLEGIRIKLLSLREIFNIYDLVAFNYYFHGNMMLYGIPSAEKGGTAIKPYAALGISVDCKDKEGAWSFIRTFLYDQYQTKLAGRALPATKTGFDSIINDYMAWVSAAEECTQSILLVMM